jgi:hypothetical protein
MLPDLLQSSAAGEISGIFKDICRYTRIPPPHAGESICVFICSTAATVLVYLGGIGKNVAKPSVTVVIVVVSQIN